MKRVAAAVLACLLLSACGAQKSGGGVLGRASGLDEEETLLYIGGAEVPAWRYLYWLAYTCDRVAQRYEEAGVALDWQAPLSGGTLADYAKDQALADTALYAVVEAWAVCYDCTGSEEQLADAAARLEEKMAAEDYRAEMTAMGLDQPRAMELAAVGVEYAALWALAEQDGSPLAPDAQALAAFAAGDGTLTVSRILVSAGADRDAAREQAAGIFSKLNGAENQAEVFAQLVKSGDDPVEKRTICPGDGQLAPELEDAAQALEEGQCSGILESEEGFSILRRLPPDTAAAKEAWFDNALQEAASGAQVTLTADYEDLDAAAFYRALESARTGGGERKNSSP